MKAAYRFVMETVSRYVSDQATSFAAAIAYYTLFSIFPLGVFLIGIGGYFLNDSQRQQLVARLTDELGGASANNVAQQVNTVSHGRAGLGIAGLVAALWSASAVFGAVRTGLNVVWHQQKARPWWRQKLANLSGVLGLVLVLALSFVASSAETFVNALAAKMFGHGAGQEFALLLGLLLTVLPLGIVYLAFSLLYIWASPPDISWRHVWPGALLAAVGFVLLSFFFGLYARSFGHYDKVYGSLGAAVAFLFYAYLIGSLILFGAELTEQWARARRLRDDDASRVTGSRGLLFLKPVEASSSTDGAVAAGELFPER